MSPGPRIPERRTVRLTQYRGRVTDHTVGAWLYEVSEQVASFSITGLVAFIVARKLKLGRLANVSWAPFLIVAGIICTIVAGGVAIVAFVPAPGPDVVKPVSVAVSVLGAGIAFYSSRSLHL
jgi:hypothetical protein